MSLIMVSIIVEEYCFRQSGLTTDLWSFDVLPLFCNTALIEDGLLLGGSGGCTGAFTTGGQAIIAHPAELAVAHGHDDGVMYHYDLTDW